jgi:hypothetical protein
MNDMTKIENYQSISGDLDVLQVSAELHDKYLADHLVVRDISPGQKAKCPKKPIGVAVLMDKARLFETRGHLLNGNTVFCETEGMDWLWVDGFLYYQGHDGRPRTLLLIFTIADKPVHKVTRSINPVELRQYGHQSDRDNITMPPESIVVDSVLRKIIFDAIAEVYMDHHDVIIDARRSFGRGCAFVTQLKDSVDRSVAAAIRRKKIDPVEIPIDILRLSGWKQHNRLATDRWRRTPMDMWCHYVLWINRRHTLDMAPRQFDETALIPTTSTITMLRNQWRTIVPAEENIDIEE